MTTTTIQFSNAVGHRQPHSRGGVRTAAARRTLARSDSPKALLDGLQVPKLAPTRTHARASPTLSVKSHAWMHGVHGTNISQQRWGPSAQINKTNVVVLLQSIHTFCFCLQLLLQALLPQRLSLLVCTTLGDSLHFCPRHLRLNTGQFLRCGVEALFLPGEHIIQLSLLLLKTLADFAGFRREKPTHQGSNPGTTGGYRKPPPPRHINQSSRVNSQCDVGDGQEQSNKHETSDKTSKQAGNQRPPTPAHAPLRVLESSQVVQYFLPLTPVITTGATFSFICG